MFFRKYEKKGHPYIALMIGALAAVGICTVKRCGMDYIKQKWKKISSCMSFMQCVKNIKTSVCDTFGDGTGE